MQRNQPLTLSELRRSLEDQPARDQASSNLWRAEHLPTISEPTHPGIRLAFGLTKPQEDTHAQ